MAVQSPSSYRNIGEDVLKGYINGYDASCSRIYDNRNYDNNDHWPTPDQEGTPYEWNNAWEYKGGHFLYKIDTETGDVLFRCDGKHTKPYCYSFIDSYYSPSSYSYRILQDAQYHVTGCPKGGSKDKYFLYLGPYSFLCGRGDLGNNVYTDMGFSDDCIETGNGAVIDLNNARYFKNCDIGNYLVDGGKPAYDYCVTETGLHAQYVTPYGPTLMFVIMPGVVIDTPLRVKQPRLTKIGEAYYKGDSIIEAPYGMSPIEGYSYYETCGIRIDFDWNTNRYHVHGKYVQSEISKKYNDIDYFGFNMCKTLPLPLGHKFKFIPPKFIGLNDNRIKVNWTINGKGGLEEMIIPDPPDPYYPLNPMRNDSWNINYSSSYPDENANVYVWGFDKDGRYEKLKDGYEITVTKDKYEGTYYDSVAISSITVGANFGSWQEGPIPDGTVVDFYIEGCKLISLSGKDKNPQPEPDPPPQRPEPAKPAEPDIVWNLGTSFVISPDSYETGLLDNYESLIWNEVYNDVGDFEVYTCVDDDILKICKPGNMITRADSDKIMIIESVKITTDVESGNHITVKGRSYESVLDRRIIWDQTTVSGSVHDAIKKLITDAIIEPKNECRKIDNFIFEDSTEEAVLQYQMDEAQFEGESLLESIKKICDIFHLGFKIYMNEEGQFAFKLYSGTDRSYYQEDLPYVIFSHNFGNLLDSEFITDSYNYKTTMLVMSDVEDEDIKTKRVTIGDGYSGMNRREVSYKSSTSPNKESGAGKYTNEEFARMLNEDGTRQLTEYKVVNQFQGSADIHQMYIYGEDFFLGDIVQIVDEFGNSACSRVNRLVISHDSNGIYSYPEFEVFERGNKIKISTGSMDADNPSINVKYNDSLTTEHFASEYSTEYTPLYELVGVAYEAVQEKSFTIKSLKRVMFRGKIYDENTVLATFPFNVFTDLEVNEYIDEEETYS